jgi:hypothetical protein
MVNEWQRARDKRVEEAKRRQTVYSSFDYQKVMIEDIKRPMIKNLMVILSPESSKTGNLRGEYILRQDYLISGIRTRKDLSNTGMNSFLTASSAASGKGF